VNLPVAQFFLRTLDLAPTRSGQVRILG